MIEATNYRVKETEVQLVDIDQAIHKCTKGQDKLEN